MTTIGIIGGGPGGISLCLQLHEALIHSGLHQSVEIIVFEKKSRLGVGLPYDDHETCYRINLNKNVMEPIPGVTGQFSNWIDATADLINNIDFPPRFYFGRYLESIALLLQQDAEKTGVKIIFLTEHDVFDIKPLENSSFEVQSYHKNTITRHRVNNIVLSLGHLPSSNFSDFIGQPGYQHNPWDQHAFDAIKPNNTVCILGSKLTAIDVALKLQTMKHQEKIYMVSASGQLPTIKGGLSSYTLRYLIPDIIRKCIGQNVPPLRLNTILSLLEQELSQCLGTVFKLDKFMDQSTSISAIKRINHEINKIEAGEADWQKILSVFYQFMSRLWPLLNLDDQRLFHTHYHSLLMTYLCSVPLESGYIIQKMLVTDQLRVMGNFSAIYHTYPNYSIQFKSAPPIFADHIVNATGAGDDVTQSSLLKNLLIREMIVKHPLGGIHVQHDTLNIIDKTNAIKQGLYAMGDIVKGSCFTLVEIGGVAKQSSVIVQQILRWVTSAGK